MYAIDNQKSLRILIDFSTQTKSVKFCKNIKAIEGGMPIEAMVDLTGGLAERYELKDSRYKHSPPGTNILYKQLKDSR